MNKKNCIVALMCALSVLLSSFAFGFESNAMELYRVGYSQPPTGENNGYMNVIYMDSSGNKSCDTYWWYIAPYQQVDVSNGSLTTSSMDVDVQSSRGKITFTAKTASNVSSRVLVVKLNQAGSMEIVWIQNFVYQSEFYIDMAYSYPIWSFACFGNVSEITYDYDYNVDRGFTVMYSDEGMNYDLFSDMAIALGKLEISNQAIYEQVFESNSNLRKIWKNQDELEEWLADALAIIDAQNTEQNAELDRIYEELQDIHETLLESKDKDSTDKFAEDSNSQSDKLNQMNEQNKMDKIDVDSASSSVDANIDGNAIANYGVVLSSITGQGKVVQLMLIVLSVGLVSYVLFGKR